MQSAATHFSQLLAVRFVALARAQLAAVHVDVRALRRRVLAAELADVVVVPEAISARPRRAADHATTGETSQYGAEQVIQTCPTPGAQAVGEHVRLARLELHLGVLLPPPEVQDLLSRSSRLRLALIRHRYRPAQPSSSCSARGDPAGKV